MVTRRSVSSAVRLSIEATIEGTEGSRAGSSMTTDYPIGHLANRLEKRGASPAGGAHRAPSRVYAFCGTLEMASWYISISLAMPAFV